MADTSSSPGGTDEQRERYRELLEELRTIIPGVQVLLAFLLTVPFSSRFAELDSTGDALFVASLVASALSVVVFLVPTAYHRLASHGRRQERIDTGVKTTLAGLVLLAIAIVLALLVVVRFIYDGAVGLVAAAIVFAAIVGLWLLLPISREQGQGQERGATRDRR